MRNFRDVYQSAIDELPKYHIDAEKVRDELHHRRMTAAKRKRQIAAFTGAACIFLLFGFGTATAVNYRSSVIKVSDNGFNIAIGIKEEELAREFVDQDMGSAAQAEGADRACGAESADKMDMAEAAQHKAAGEAGGAAGLALGDELEPDMDIPSLEAEIIEGVEYESVESYRQQTGLVIAVPEIEWLGSPEELEEQRVTSYSNRVNVAYSFGEAFFSMCVADSRGAKGYSTKAYMGEAVNERSITNSQGLSYLVFDSEEEGEITATHAAISVNGRDITLGFFGFDSDTVDNVLDQLDLSVYFKE